jgi:hypothetical protein
MKTLILSLSGVVLFAAACSHLKPTGDALQAPSAQHPQAEASSVGLVPYYTTPISHFDQMTRFPAFKTVPRGEQKFSNVPFRIEGMICLWGEGNVKKLNIVFPEEISDIQVNRFFETLYVYHTGFFVSADHTPVSEVVLHYQDGSSLTEPMRYGEDLVDWCSHPGDGRTIEPTRPRSRVAWVGGSSSTNEVHPVRLFITAIPNPKPGLEVTTIDVRSLKSQTAECIMAVTVGKADLMK